MKNKNNQSKVHNPHDALTKAALSQKQVAQEVFEQPLPASITKEIDFSSLKLWQSQQTQDDLKKFATDMIYEAKLKKSGQPCLCYIHCEQETKPDRQMPIRMLRYKCNHLIQYMKQYPKKPLPPIFTLVIYNGKRTYPYATDLLKLFEDVSLGKETLINPMHLLDLSSTPDDQLLATPWSGALLGLLKHIQRPVCVNLSVMHWLISCLNLKKQGKVGILRAGFFYGKKEIVRMRVSLKGVLPIGFVCLSFLGVQPALAHHTLSEVVMHTVETNPEILTEVHLRHGSDQEVRQARAGYFPTLDLHGRYGYERVRKDKGEDWLDGTRQEVGVALRQMLFDGKHTCNEVARTQAKTNADAYSVFSRAENIGLKAVEAYINVLTNEELVQIAKKNLAAHSHAYEMIKKRVKRGVSGESDRHQVRSRWELSRVNLFAAQNRLMDARAVFHRVTGLQAVHLMPVPEPNVEALPVNEHVAINEGIMGHPRLRSAFEDVEEAKAYHRVTYAPNYPHLDLVLSADDEINVEASDVHESRYGAFLELHYNLFRGGKDLARQRQSAYEVQRAMEIRNNTYREVIENMRLAWNLYATETKRLPALHEHEEFAKRTLLAYRKQFKVGKRDILDILDAENEVFEARTECLKSHYELIIAKYRILDAKGALLTFLHVPLPAAATVPYRDKQILPIR